MNIESKIWAFTNAGTKKHAFQNGVALCRSNVRRNAGSVERFGENYHEVKTYGGICVACETKFNDALEAAEAEQVTETRTPAPEGFVQGEAVIVQRPGRQPFTGVVAHIHAAPGYVAVLDDRYRAVSTHPKNFVSHVEQVTETPDETEAVTNHPDAGTYNPMDGADYLKVQGVYVVAEVHTDGTYAVFAGAQRVERGRLNGAEGSLMTFFTNIANLWSARIDDERAQEAARRAEAEYAHHAEANHVSEGRSMEEITTVIEALGGRYEWVAGSIERGQVSYTEVLCELKIAARYGVTVELSDVESGAWYVDLLNRHGANIARYRYVGH